jgi:hypothetical protein
MARHRVPSSPRDKSATWLSLGEPGWVLLSEARKLVVEAFHSSRGFAERWLKEELIAKRVRWWASAIRPSNASVDGFWERRVKVDWDDNSATKRELLPVVGFEGVEIAGVWVSRADLGGRLAEDCRQQEEVPSPPTSPADTPAASPAPRRPSDAAVERCFREIQAERPDDPPSEPRMLAEMTRRLGTSPIRQRVRDLWKRIAPLWKRPQGHPRAKKPAR